MVPRSRMMATRVQDDIDEEAPAPLRKANGMSLCNRMHALCGQLRVVCLLFAFAFAYRNCSLYNCGGIPGICSILHRQVGANSP